MAWLTLDTAPKDGTRILGWNPHWEMPCVVWWELIYVTRDGIEMWCDRDGDCQPQPTHWLPIPKLPMGAVN